MMKNIKSFVFVMMLALLNIAAIPAFASGADSNLKKDMPANNGTNIAVVVPTSDTKKKDIPITVATPNLYPVSVSEKRTDSKCEIIRVYELSEDENPDHISRDNFEREGYSYELAEIVKSEMQSFDSREHIETITINTKNNDIETVLKMLSQTIEHTSEDGYTGTLTLDVSSVKTAEAGTNTSTSISTKTREYPHLSSNDSALIPKTITDSGRTYDIADIDWNDENTESIDNTELPQTYTAVATYSATISSTSVVGYDTTAKYLGVISRTTQGKTRYTANFIGVPIVVEDVEEEKESEGQAIRSPLLSSGIGEEIQVLRNADEVTDVAVSEDKVEVIDVTVADDDSKSASPILVLLLLAFVAIIFYYVGKFGKRFINKMKKPLCMAIAVTTLITMPRIAHAKDLGALPAYGFGGANAENTMHFDTAGIKTSTTHHMDTNVSNPAFSYADGELIGKLTVEKLGRTINIYEGEGLPSMNKGGGRFSYTGANTGNTAIIGHNRGRSNGYFIFVKDLKQGDVVRLEMNGITKRYAVNQLYTASETDVSALNQFGDNRLTLVTCVENQKNMRRIAVAMEV